MTPIGTDLSRSGRRALAVVLAVALGLHGPTASAERREGDARPARQVEAAPGWPGGAGGRDADTRFNGYPAADRGYDARRYATPINPYRDASHGSAERRVWSRGQVLPFDYRAAEVADPGRYHLRRPPTGFGWVGDGRNAYLMQRSTGMVLDSVPRAYEPAPPARRPHR